jgi:putative hemolysin
VRSNSETLSKPASNVIDRTFLKRLSRRQVEREAQMMIEADQRENALIAFFRNLPVDKQRDMVAIAEVYCEQHGLER